MLLIDLFHKLHLILFIKVVYVKLIKNIRIVVSQWLTHRQQKCHLKDVLNKTLVCFFSSGCLNLCFLEGYRIRQTCQCCTPGRMNAANFWAATSNNKGHRITTILPHKHHFYFCWDLDFLFHRIFIDCSSYALHYMKQLWCKNIVTPPFIVTLWNSAKWKEKNAFSTPLSQHCTSGEKYSPDSCL